MISFSLDWQNSKNKWGMKNCQQKLKRVTKLVNKFEMYYKHNIYCFKNAKMHVFEFWRENMGRKGLLPSSLKNVRVGALSATV